MGRAAFCTRPVAILQFQFLMDCAARRTGPRRGIEPVRFENRASTQFGFIWERVFQRAKVSVTDCARQAAVLHHTTHVPVFDHNRVKAAREVVGQLLDSHINAHRRGRAACVLGVVIRRINPNRRIVFPGALADRDLTQVSGEPQLLAHTDRARATLNSQLAAFYAELELFPQRKRSLLFPLRLNLGNPGFLPCFTHRKK